MSVAANRNRVFMNSNAPTTSMTTIQPKIVPYSDYFNKAFNIRLKFYSRLSFFIAFILTILLIIPFNTNIFLFPVKLILLWLSFHLIRFARDSSLEVESSKCATDIQRILSDLASYKFITLFFAFFVTNLAIFGIIYFQSSSSLDYFIASPTKTIKPFLNDNFMFFWFFNLASSIFYTIYFLAFEKFKLNIPIGLFRQDPVKYLKNLPYIKLTVFTMLKSIIVSLAVLLLYSMLRHSFFNIIIYPIIPLLNLNHQIPKSSYKISTFFILTIFNTISYLIFDILSEIYNAYASVGCLVIDKPLSSYSNTPMQTLLTGIKDYKHQLVRLTAYQELTYLSTANDVKAREHMYQGHNWTLVLEQIAFVLSNAAKSAKADLPKVTKNIEDKAKKFKMQEMKKKVSLFGNLGEYKKGFNFDINIENNNQEDVGGGDITILKKDNEEELFLKPQNIKNETNIKKDSQSGYLQIFLEFLSTHLNQYFGILHNKINIYLKRHINDSPTFFQIDNVYTHFTHLLEYLFFGSLERQSTKRIPNKVIIGNSMIIISEMLIHAKVEDKKNIVTGTLTETLTLLTKIYKGSFEFINNPPVNILGDGKCTMIEINELAIGYFFKLVVLYNNILNDLILAPEVFKLAKWCTDLALEQQREQKTSVDLWD